MTLDFNIAADENQFEGQLLKRLLERRLFRRVTAAGMPVDQATSLIGSGAFDQLLQWVLANAPAITTFVESIPTALGITIPPIPASTTVATLSTVAASLEAIALKNQNDNATT